MEYKRAAKKVPIDYRNGKIYRIVNTINDIIYVGSSTQLLCKRFACHKSRSFGNDKHSTNKLCDAMRELGAKNFHIYLIENYSCGSKAELEAREYDVTNTYPKDKLYNSMFNGKVAGETKKQISASLTGALNVNFSRGSISRDARGSYIFIWSVNNTKHAKSYSFGKLSKRTEQQAYMLCVDYRNMIHPLTHKNYMDELPLGLLEEELL